jgi:3-deoxy-D-manno-octulosonic acid kinase
LKVLHAVSVLVSGPRLEPQAPSASSMIVERFEPASRGGILYDAARLRKPDDAVFTKEYWAARAALEEFSGGRGSVCVLHAQDGDWILRHYRRGGFAARISPDRYFWTGANATRSFREWRLLADLHNRGLPVPSPIAARYVREGLFYRADLITARLPNARTLSALICERALEAEHWERIGRTIARFHEAGVHHADLNANNIMLAGDDVYLIDFDRGRIRPRGSWEQTVIARLKRSLEKLKGKEPDAHFGEREWQRLLGALRANGGLRMEN